ncbi:major facilitator superfamily permease [Streptomyces davaonensis JCM 4913]|uniref:Major facilitator superfamily permease n=1 Tax=Streptomyces davaonensis (strain DSM 101723 / JCM 4913 / KCC S-0913 / 768) TaxID=1214101 RepID=K4R1V2_STRDJ|nr:MFS transporter [Streptomyces davaonensis]CCK30256.1 major facilitator superfamily permease [Streptomyces davaonensis JCM 4913]
MFRFRLLVTSYAVSAYGNYLNLIALSLFSYEVTGTAFGIGAVMALRLLAGVVAGPIAGAVGARVGRRGVMIGADAAQATAMAVLAVCGARTPLWVLGCVVVVLGAGNTFFSVALRSAVPVMVGQEGRAHANGLLVTARSLATVLGFASAAPVIAYGGYGTAFAVNAASFVVSGAALLVLRPRTEEESSGESTEPVEPGGFTRAWAGVPALVLGLVALRGTDALASSSHNVALPVVAEIAEASDPALYMSRFWAAWAVGTVLAHQVLKRGGKARGERAFALGTCAMSCSFVLAFTGLPAVALMVAAAAAGFADGWTEIVYTSRLQATGDRERGRLFGLSATAEQAGFALGTVVAAAALESLSPLTVVALFHGVAVCGALALLLASRAGRVDRKTTGLSYTRDEPMCTAPTEEEGTHGTRTGDGRLPGA